MYDPDVALVICIMALFAFLAGWGVWALIKQLWGLFA